MQKDPSKGTAVNSNRPIIYLPMIWKTVQKREQIYNSLARKPWKPREWNEQEEEEV